MIFSIALPKLWPVFSLSPSLRKWVKPMLFLSLGLHAFILLAPLPHSETATPKKEQKKSEPHVKIAAIPSSQKLASPKPSVTKHVIASLPKVLNSKRPAIVLPRKSQPHSASASVAKLTPSPKTTPQTPQSPAAITPSATVPSTDGTSYDPANPMSDFPQFPGAVAGCLGLPSCFATGKPLAEVSQFFEQQLPAKKFAVQPVTNEVDRKVYQISKGGVTQFLSVIFDGTAANYVLAEQPLSMKDLQTTVQVPPDFTANVLAQFSPSGTDPGAQAPAVSPELFADPTAFFSEVGGVDAQGFDVAPTARTEIDSLKVVAGQTPQQVDSA
ncbi:MAG TPA: hypothetical protein V6D19_22540, partial [Stenomitos sp.]